MTTRQATGIGLCTLALGLAAAYVVFQDHLPPRTGVKVARVVSDLPIPRKAAVLVFDDRWSNLNGNGSAYVVLRVSDSVARDLARKAGEEGYVPLASDEALSDEVARVIDPSTAGLMRIAGTRQSGSSVVVDTVNARVIVHQYIS